MKTKAKHFVYIMLTAVLVLYSPWSFAQTDLSEKREMSAMEMQPPNIVMDAIGVKEGMVIGEIGAGRGRYTVYLARRVGKKGKIFANDINASALDYLQNRCKENGFDNVEIIKGENDDPMFPENSLDMAFMVWVYHMIDQPDGLLKNLKKSLKPGATLVIVDPIDSEIDAEFHVDRSDPNNKVPTIKQRIESSAKVAGYEVIRIDDFLPKDYIFILKALER